MVWFLRNVFFFKEFFWEVRLLGEEGYMWGDFSFRDYLGRSNIYVNLKNFYDVI